MTEERNGASYTGALYQVLETLGRIDGKFDALDSRLRSMEQFAAAQRATEDLERARVDRVEERVVELSRRDDARFTLRTHWKWVMLAALPLILASVSAIADLVRFIE